MLNHIPDFYGERNSFRFPSDFDIRGDIFLTPMDQLVTLDAANVDEPCSYLPTSWCSSLANGEGSLFPTTPPIDVKSPPPYDSGGSRPSTPVPSSAVLTPSPLPEIRTPTPPCSGPIDASRIQLSSTKSPSLSVPLSAVGGDQVEQSTDDDDEAIIFHSATWLCTGAVGTVSVNDFYIGIGLARAGGVVLFWFTHSNNYIRHLIRGRSHRGTPFEGFDSAFSVPYVDSIVEVV